MSNEFQVCSYLPVPYFIFFTLNTRYSYKIQFIHVYVNISSISSYLKRLLYCSFYFTFLFLHGYNWQNETSLFRVCSGSAAIQSLPSEENWSLSCIHSWRTSPITYSWFHLFSLFYKLINSQWQSLKTLNKNNPGIRWCVCAGFAYHWEQLSSQINFEFGRLCSE